MNALPLDARFAEHFPVTVGDVRVDVLSIEATPSTVVLYVRLTVCDAGVPVDCKEQGVRLEVAERGDPPQTWRVERRPLRPDEVDPQALAGHVRHHLARGGGTTAMPFELFEPPGVWVPLAWDEKAVGLAEVMGAVQDQAGAHGFAWRGHVVAQWPEEAQTVFFLSLLYAMAGGNGLGWFFLDQTTPDEVMGCHAALGRAGCPRLVRLYGQALDLAAREGYPAVLDPDADWLAENRVAGADGWEGIDSHEDGGSWRLLEEELVPAAERFLRRERGVVFGVG